jgi:hypothetical protein
MKVAGICVSAAIGSYAAMWLFYEAVPQYGPNTNVVCNIGLCRDTDAVKAGYETLRSADPNERTGSVRLFSELLRRNAASPYAWCNLGDALLETGDIAGAKKCFQRAAELGGNVPPVMLRIVNFYCRVVEIPRALQASRALLQLSSEYDDIVFGLFSRLRLDVDVALLQGIGKNPRAANAFMQYMLHKPQLTQAWSAWRWLERGNAVEPAVALQYISTMWEAGRREESATAWMARFGPAEHGYGRSNFIYNGDFEREFSRSVFDWVYTREAYANVSMDDSVACSGTRALRLQFDGNENPEYLGPRQIVWIAPGAYTLHACMRASGVTSNEGLRLQVIDADKPVSPIGETRQVLGTTDWEDIDTAVVIGPHTRAIEIRIVRRRSWKFDNALDGTIWLDRVTLSPRANTKL